jgi:ppGpp synthetase/RelA/SpoT-type nucleotidyltranferase
MRESEERISNSKIDKLGDRLRDGTETDDDLRTLDAFQAPFLDATSSVRNIISEHLMCQYDIAERLKTLNSIRLKLRRERTRLSTMQDLGGLRIVVSDRALQDKAVATLRDVVRLTIYARSLGMATGPPCVNM